MAKTSVLCDNSRKRRGKIEAPVSSCVHPLTDSMTVYLSAGTCHPTIEQALPSKRYFGLLVVVRTPAP
eukprot:scaffold20100_cov99-Amphora_coffeaeformis.AAC.1